MVPTAIYAKPTTVSLICGSSPKKTSSEPKEFSYVTTGSLVSSGSFSFEGTNSSFCKTCCESSNTPLRGFPTIPKKNFFSPTPNVVFVSIFALYPDFSVTVNKPCIANVRPAAASKGIVLPVVKDNTLRRIFVIAAGNPTETPGIGVEATASHLCSKSSASALSLISIPTPNENSALNVTIAEAVMAGSNSHQ